MTASDRRPAPGAPSAAPTYEDVRAARTAIAGVAVRTPLVAARSFATPGREVLLKLETTQPVGAFKLRGAVNAIATLTETERARGVICASTGNHGRALAYAASRLGVKATVCMSHLVPRNKVEAIRAAGAEVVLGGRSQDDAQAEVDRRVGLTGATEIPPFDHAAVIAGQGTIAIEIFEDDPDVDTLLVPLSGGGLIGGIALAAKTLKPDVRVIGLSMERGAAMAASLRAGRPVAVVEEETLADSLGGGIGLLNRFTFPLVRDLVDEVCLLHEDQIAQAMRSLFLNEGWVAEGAGAVGIAPLLYPGLVALGRRVAVVISGRNIDMTRFLTLVSTRSEERFNA